MSDKAVFGECDTLHGKFRYPLRDMYIGRSLQEYGQFCEHEFRLISQIIKPTDIVVDAGANIGTLSVALAKKLGKGLVYCFEPQPVICALLSHNLIANDCANAIPMTLALGANDGEIQVPYLNYQGANNFGGISFANQKTDRVGHLTTRIPVRRLDDVISPPRLRLIKADVEQMEADLLQGAQGLIHEFKPVLYLECEQPDHFAPIATEIQKLGYKAFWHVSPLFDPNNWAKNQENVFGGTFCVNLLCVPENVQVKGLTPAIDETTHPKFKQTNV